MAYKLIWSPAARDDLHDIVIFIARDNPNRAMSFGYELISQTESCQNFQSWVESLLNTGVTIFARSCFGRIELCTELITSGSSARSLACSIRREEFRSYGSRLPNTVRVILLQLICLSLEIVGFFCQPLSF